jgi:hypothetical protein
LAKNQAKKVNKLKLSRSFLTIIWNILKGPVGSRTVYTCIPKFADAL